MHTHSSIGSLSSDEVVLSKGKASWTTQEEVALVQYFFKNKSQMSGASFKDTVFQQAAIAIKPLHHKGAEKNDKSCKTKWKNICIFFVHVLPVS